MTRLSAARLSVHSTLHDHRSTVGKWAIVGESPRGYLRFARDSMPGVEAYTDVLLFAKEAEALSYLRAERRHFGMTRMRVTRVYVETIITMRKDGE